MEVAPRDPNMFWSVAEDGDVRQFDTRCRSVLRTREHALVTCLHYCNEQAVVK